MMPLLFCPPSGLRLFVSPYYIAEVSQVVQETG